MRGEELRDTGRRTGEDVEGPKWEGSPKGSLLLGGVWGAVRGLG